jgi:uncharacterized protein YqjF (DUF2071 family)
MHPALAETGHRPWPLPGRPWNWRQRWCDLLFAHWPVPAAALRHLVPDGLTIQEFDGTSWVGVVPFRMEGVMLRGLPDVPGISAFLELNLRLYVERDGRPGVWFLSLDASNPLAVWAARTFFHLPYFRAQMSLSEFAGEFSYFSQRTVGGHALEAVYGPDGDVYRSTPGTLEHWLTERYCLYAQSGSGQLYRAQIHHHPWPLQPARAEFLYNALAVPHGFTLDGAPALLHFSRSIDVIVWDLEPVETRAGGQD